MKKPYHLKKYMLYKLFLNTEKLNVRHNSRVKNNYENRNNDSSLTYPSPTFDTVLNTEVVTNQRRIAGNTLFPLDDLFPINDRFPAENIEGLTSLISKVNSTNRIYSILHIMYLEYLDCLIKIAIMSKSELG